VSFSNLQLPRPAMFTRLDRNRRERAIVVGLFVLAALYPFFYRMLPGFLPWPELPHLIVMAYYAILALGLNIVVGFAGLLDLGYVAFFIIGAYTTAFLASPHFNIHISWWIVVLIAVIAAAVFGILLGAPTLRLRGDYLAIVTLGFGEIAPLVIRNLGDVTLRFGETVLIGPKANLTGGNSGINPIDPPTLPIPWGGGQVVFSNTNLIASLYLVLALLAATYFFSVRLRDSRLGRAWMAIREDETAAAAMGINTVTTKLLAFALGASFSGFAGAFVGSYQTAIFPEIFKFSISITILIMVILGGMGSLRGAVLGAFAIQYVNLTLLQWLGQFINPPLNSIGRDIGIDFLRTFQLHSLNFLFFGIALVLMMLYKPEGLLPVAARKAELHGEGIAAETTSGSADDLAAAEALHADESLARSEAAAREAEGRVQSQADGAGLGDLSVDTPEPGVDDGTEPEDRREPE
jgi:branched-chain amino acid transport system permease protein